MIWFHPMFCLITILKKVSIAKPKSQFLLSEEDNDLMRKESFEAFGKWGNKEKGEEWRGGGDVGCEQIRNWGTETRNLIVGRKQMWEKEQQREKIEWDVGSEIGCFRPGGAARVPGLCRQHHVHRQILWVRHNDDVQEDPGGDHDDCSGAACLLTLQLKMIGNVSGVGKTWSPIKCFHMNQSNPKCTGILQKRITSIAKMRGANFISEGKIEILKKSVDCVFFECVFLIFSPPIIQYPLVINWLLPRGGDQMDWDNYHRLDTIHNWMDRYPPQPRTPQPPSLHYFSFSHGCWIVNTEDPMQMTEIV